jgi:tripartite motif-containing protein 71
VAQWGGDGRANGRFHYPTDVAVGQSGRVVVADAYNHRVQTFTRDGAFVDKWGGTGYGLSGGWAGWFRLAKAVAVDRKGAVYVADAFNHRIQKFTPGGELVGAWSGDASDGAQALRYPAGVTIDDNGAVYVTDFLANTIVRLRCR